MPFFPVNSQSDDLGICSLADSEDSPPMLLIFTSHVLGAVWPVSLKPDPGIRTSTDDTLLICLTIFLVIQKFAHPPQILS